MCCVWDDLMSVFVCGVFPAKEKGKMEVKSKEQLVAICQTCAKDR